MELQHLQQQLINQLEKDNQETVIHTDIWCIPMYTYEVAYQPVRKKTMDILMKILLFSCQKASFENAEQLSEILLVEPLFIEDLLRKMQKNGLLERQDNVYRLTKKGKRQYGRGIFEETLEPAVIELLYSPVHHQILQGDIDEVLDFDDFPDQLYRYTKEEEVKLINEDFVMKEIQALKRDELEETRQEIKSILSMENTQINDVPCIEFIVKNAENKELFPRVWNTLFNNWDSCLEKEIMEKEKWSGRLNFRAK